MKGLLFTYLLTYGGAVMSLFNQHVGLLIRPEGRRANAWPVGESNAAWACCCCQRL